MFQKEIVRTYISINIGPGVMERVGERPHDSIKSHEFSKDKLMEIQKFDRKEKKQQLLKYVILFLVCENC